MARKTMRILVIGAGVVGSFNAARLFDGGQDVTLLARGQRLTELREHGVVMEDARTGQRTVTRVPLTDRVGPDDRYELALVVVRRNQIPSVLPMLARPNAVPAVLFLGNNAAGSEDLVQALGRGRVLIGVVNAGGERKDGVVRYLSSKGPLTALQLTELDGRPTARSDRILEAFRSSGLPARFNPAVDEFLKTHAAGLPGFAGALYLAGGLRELAHRPDLLHLFLESMRECLRALRQLGIRLTPAAIRPLIFWVPLPVVALGLRFFFQTTLAKVGGESHANAAPDEMKELADEFRDLIRRAGTSAPASERLFAAVDARAATARAVAG